MSSAVAVPGLRDPTRSAGLRRHGRGMVNRNVFELHRSLRQTLQDHDLIGLRAREDDFLAYEEARSNRLERGDMMLRDIVTNNLERNSEWLGLLIVRAVQHGIDQAGQELKVAVEEIDANEVMIFHNLAAGVELKGISNETQRRMTRHVIYALDGKRTPEVLMREVRLTLEKVTKLRLLLLVNTAVVRAVNDGKLLGYHANGIRRVGIEVEWLPSHRHTHDAVVLQDRDTRKARVRKRKKANRERRSAMFAAKQQAKREAAERLLEEKLSEGGVNVLTAGDDKVCEECEDIAADGPYDLDTARGLIPAHPNCRCAFVPYDDQRFAAIEEMEE